MECLATAPVHDAWRVYRATELVQTAHESQLREHRPFATVSDVPFWWTTAVVGWSPPSSACRTSRSTPLASSRSSP